MVLFINLFYLCQLVFMYYWLIIYHSDSILVTALDLHNISLILNNDSRYVQVGHNMKLPTSKIMLPGVLYIVENQQMFARRQCCQILFVTKRWQHISENSGMNRKCNVRYQDSEYQFPQIPVPEFCFLVSLVNGFYKLAYMNIRYP